MPWRFFLASHAAKQRDESEINPKSNGSERRPVITTLAPLSANRNAGAGPVAQPNAAKFPPLDCLR
jgi:hypothetical protein